MVIRTGRASAAVRSWLRPLVDLRLLGLLLVLAAGIALIALRPLDYRITVGRPDGRGSDLPFVRGWNTPEQLDGVPVRWTKAESHVVFAGLARQPLVAELQLLPASANPQFETGRLMVAAAGVPLAVLPLHPQAGTRQHQTLHLLVPPRAVTAGALDLSVSAPAWRPANDPRDLGVLVSAVQLRQAGAGDDLVRSAGSLPAQLFWPLLALPMVWLPLRRWLPRMALLVAAVLSGLLLWALATERPRFALAAVPAMLALGWALLLATGLRALIGTYAPRLGLFTSARLLDYVALLFFALFTLRYAGRLYPESMPGDLGFHVNRQNDVMRGMVLLLSRHRGIDFPYPPALYVLLLPFRLLPITPEAQVEFGNALIGALGVFPLACLAHYSFRSERITMLATTAYALLAPAIMALWWSFLPHVFAQELAVLLLAALVAGWSALDTWRGVLLLTSGLVLLWTGHFGFYINLSALLLLVVGLVALTERRRGSGVLRALSANTRGLILAFALAQAIVFAIFYSAYLPLFTHKLVVFWQGGMGAVQEGRAALPRSQLLRMLWHEGLMAHYATVGLPLALLGGYRLHRRGQTTVVRPVLAALLVVALLQGLLPLASGSTVTTRWLSLIAPFVAIGLGLLVDALWQRGRPGRLMGLALLGWIGWTTLWMWVQALAYRIRPPEPF